MHQRLEMLFSSFNSGPDFVNAALAWLRHVFNVRASERNRPNFPKLGYYDHYVLDAINEIALRIKGVNSVTTFICSSLIQNQ